MKCLLKELIKWSLQCKLLSQLWDHLEALGTYALQQRRATILHYSTAEQNRILDLIRKIKEKNQMLLSEGEAFQLFMAVKSTEKISGDFAEVGTYRGGSARLICEAKGERVLHLFDTFDGLPEVGEMDSSWFHKGKYAAPLREVSSVVQGFKNVHIHRGIFPGTGEAIKGRSFSFIHLDVDTYESTLNSFKFFYPLVNRGGMILSHDYQSARGVRKAIDEFMVDKPETVLPLTGEHCLIAKL